MDIERIKEIQPYDKERDRKQPKLSDNKLSHKSFIYYLKMAELDITNHADAICYQTGDSVLMHYNRLKNRTSKALMDLGEE